VTGTAVARRRSQSQVFSFACYAMQPAD